MEGYKEDIFKIQQSITQVRLVLVIYAAFVVCVASFMIMTKLMDSDSVPLIPSAHAATLPPSDGHFEALMSPPRLGKLPDDIEAASKVIENADGSITMSKEEIEKLGVMIQRKQNLIEALKIHNKRLDDYILARSKDKCA